MERNFPLPAAQCSEGRDQTPGSSPGDPSRGPAALLRAPLACFYLQNVLDLTLCDSDVLIDDSLMQKQFSLETLKPGQPFSYTFQIKDQVSPLVILAAGTQEGLLSLFLHPSLQHGSC